MSPSEVLHHIQSLSIPPRWLGLILASSLVTECTTLGEVYDDTCTCFRLFTGTNTGSMVSTNFVAKVLRLKGPSKLPYQPLAGSQGAGRLYCVRTLKLRFKMELASVAGVLGTQVADPLALARTSARLQSQLHVGRDPAPWSMVTSELRVSSFRPFSWSSSRPGLLCPLPDGTCMRPRPPTARARHVSEPLGVVPRTHRHADRATRGSTDRMLSCV